MYRILIVVSGYRDVQDAGLVEAEIDMALARHGGEDQEIAGLCHGDCRGVDRLAAAWAKKRGLNVKAFPAKWGKWDPKNPPKDSPGRRRNIEMLEAAQRWLVAPNRRDQKGEKMVLCVVIPSDKSKGTWHFLREAQSRQTSHLVVHKSSALLGNKEK